MTGQPYKLTLDLRVLDHLGIKLYSNAAAVLSEAVANAWDADAKSVVIDISATEITITDDGVGMKRDEINERFLSVGYDKRGREGKASAGGRPFMGRKGIGKLALFSIADEIHVHTTRGGATDAFLMETKEIRKTVSSGSTYYPKPIAFAGGKQGTRLILKKLKKKRTTAAIAGLRKRIARRFSIIGQPGKGSSHFEVKINGKTVGYQDRDDLRAVEFLWEFGKQRLPSASCPRLKKRFVISDEVQANKPSWKVRGWLGAAATPHQLRDSETGSINNIVVLARGRLIQENVLDKLSFSRILVSYLTGQVDADFLDLEDMDDIATSDRQRLLEDDERTGALSAFLRKSLVSIQDEWTDLRNEARGKDAVAENPALAQWLDSLKGTNLRKSAERLLGLVRSVELEDETERNQLYRSGILAFERLRLTEESHNLSNLSDLSAARILPLLTDLSVIEASMYRDIVKARLDVIGELQSLVEGKEKEKILQKHLFDNLWLLDPGWERATGSQLIESTLKKNYAIFKPHLTDAQSKGRLDIRYRTNAGQHIVVELKKSDRLLHIAELVEQGEKYVSALEKCLEASGESNPQIAVIFVLGKPVAEEASSGGKKRVSETLKGINGRIVYYDTLIATALRQYQEYFDKSEKTDKIAKIIDALSGKSKT